MGCKSEKKLCHVSTINWSKNLSTSKSTEISISKYDIIIKSKQYPLKYDHDLITLNLLKEKQRVGEVTKQEVDQY